MNDTINLGSTDTTRDFLYVVDTAAGLMRCAEVEAAVGEVINLGTGVEVSIGAVVERVARMVDRDVAVEVEEQRLRPPDSEVERLVADCAKANRILDWKPATAFDDGLSVTLDWTRGALDAYKPTIYNV
jgi:nucleoside-diphosphate-sugar epimerase